MMSFILMITALIVLFWLTTGIQSDLKKQRRLVYKMLADRYNERLRERTHEGWM